MFRSKKDVDRHVKDIFLKLKNEEEKNLRCYNIAKLYYQVGDYESAKRYVSNYLEIRDGCAGAHKLLGQALEALGQKEAALTQYKISLELEPRQEDVVLKVCELLTDMDVNTDMNRVRYWVDRADKQFPHHPTVFKLKEKLLTGERPNDNSEDLEALIASELSARPTDVHLRVKLLKHYMAKQRLDHAYEHATGVEAAHSHRNSIVWYQFLCELLTKCKESKESNWNFWVLYLSALERYAALCLKEQGNETKKTVPEAAQAVFNFDQSLTEFKLEEFSTNINFTEHMLSHMWGQLNFHLACLLLRKTKREQGSWSEAGRLCAPLLLSALHVTPVDPTAVWVIHLKDRLKSQIRLWHREGSYRCSQAGHVLQDYGRDDSKKLLDKIDKFCTSSWRERVYQRIFINRLHQQFIKTSYFSNSTNSNPPLCLCSQNELKRYDAVSEEVWPDSLHHQVWRGLKTRPHRSQNKDNGPHPNQISHVFPELQFSVYNLNQAAPDSLSRLDVDAFLNAATFCAAAVIEEQQLSGFLNPDKLPTLPADLTTTLCTCAQEKWWSLAYKMYSKQETLEGDIGEIRQELQRGLEVVRCIGNYGLHPALLVHLARIFHHRVKMLKEKDKEHSDIPALEARCEIYWSNAIPLLERLQNNQTIRITNTKLFNYQGKEMNNAELTNALEEGKLLLAQRFVRDKQYEQAIDALQALKCPEASFQQGQIYKLLADEIVSSMPRESLTSEMRSQHIIMLSKVRNCLYLTLDRLRSPGINPKHPLNAELCTHIADIESELKKIDPDLSRGDLSRNECGGMSDESYSSAHSIADQPITNVPLQTITNLNTSVNMLSTPQRNTHRTPKQSSTPCRPQHQDILDLSRNRTEARPSPERLDAQIRQMIHARDNIMQTIMEQNKAVLESHKVMMEKIEELTKEIAELRKESQRQRAQPQQVNINPNLEDNLYVLGEDDYNDLNYNANQTANASSISGNMFPPTHRHPYSPLVYPSATAFHGYYQGGIPFSDPNAQAIPSLYPPNVYPMPVLYPNARAAKVPDNILHQGLFTSRLPTQLPDLMPSANQPLQIPLQKPETPKQETIIKDAPVNKAPPVNVVITTSDTLPTSAPVVQPTLSVTIPPHYRLGNTSTPTTAEQLNVPHCYQISMPSQATIPTTVNLPPLSTTLTTTPANISITETAKGSNIDICSTGSLNTSSEILETEHDPIPDFVPVIPLPAEVKVTTGEEDEVTLYCERAKLFRFVDKEWKERGVGNVKLLKNAEGKVRLLMRRDQVLKICANHMLRPDMELTPMSNNDKAWIWVANDFADEEVKLEKLCIKFKTAEEALSFKENFDKAKMSLAHPSKSTDKSVEDTKDQSKSTESTFPSKPIAAKQSAEIVPACSTPSEKPKGKAAPAAVVGGFSFMSKPVIQAVSTTESSKTGQKATEEATKVSPFAGFTFNKTFGIESSPTVDQKNANAITTSVTSQVPTFCFGKTATSQPDSTTTPITTSTSGSIVFGSQTSGMIPNANLTVGHSSLRRPHASSPAESVSKTIGILDASGTQSDNEEALFEGKINLRYYNTDIKQWEHRGSGQIKILWDSKTGKIRLLMTDDESSKICYNYNVLAKTSFTFQSGSETVINWSIQHGKENKAMFAATFKLPEQAQQFCSTLSSNQQRMVKDCIPSEIMKKPEITDKNVPADNATPWECSVCYTENVPSVDGKGLDSKCEACESPRFSSTTSKSPTVVTNKSAVAAANKSAPQMTTTTTTSQVPLSQLFKTPAGSWECKSCYIFNTGSNNYCVACDSPKDPTVPPKPKSNSFQVSMPNSGSIPTFSFGIPPEASKETTSGFTFQLNKPNDNTSIDSRAKSDQSGTKFVFGMPQASVTTPNKDTPFTFGATGKSYDFNFVATSPVKSPEAADNTEEEVIESDDIHFSPIIPLPDKIDVKTGEEDEEVLYSHRAKLFRFDSSVKEWKERGLGDIKLLRHKETGKLRLIMRRDQILKLCLNHFVLPDLEFTLKDEKTWLWNAADYSEGEIEYMHFACRFKNAEIAEDFKRAIDEAKKSSKISVVDKKKEETKADVKDSSNQEIEVLYEMKVTPEEKAAALKLQLPENFFAYKQKPDCSGCRGCKEPAVPLFADAPPPKASTILESKIMAENKKAAPLEVSFTSMPFSLSSMTTALTQSPALDFTVQAPISGSILKTGLTSGNATQLTASAPAMTFGTNDFISSEKKATTLSFGIPPVSFGASETQKLASTDKQASILPEKLKICSPSVSQGQITQTTPSPFDIISSTTPASTESIFGSVKTDNQFGLNTGKTIFSGLGKKESTELIKPSSFSVSTNNTSTIFSNSFGSQAKTTASPMNNASTFGTSTMSSIFGSGIGNTNSNAANSTTSSSGANFMMSSTVGKPFSFDNLSASTQKFGISSDNTSNNFGMSSSTLTTTATPNIFETKPTDASQNEGGGGFFQSNNVTFSTLATKAPQQEAFKSEPNFSFTGSGTPVFGAKTAANNSAQNKKETKTEGSDEEDGDENENGQEHEPYFEPIVPLPDVIEVRTGEEDEEKVFCERAKLYRYDNATREWKERGVGEMKILHHKEHGTYRLLLRREQVHKVVCNILITQNMEFHKLKTSNSSWLWAGMNHAEDQPCVEELAVKFKNLKLATDFKDAIDKIQQSLSEIRKKSIDDNKSEEQEPEEEEGEDEEEDEEEDEPDDDDVEGDEEDCQNLLVFENRATLYTKLNKDADWTSMALGTLLIYYDSNIFGEEIIFKSDGTIVSKTIISMNTEMQVEGNACIWTALDYALEPLTRRTLKAVFSSVQAAQQMYKYFQDGVKYAKHAEISESIYEE